MRRLLPKLAVTGIAATLVSTGAAGAAYAVSGGGYSSPSQDCPWYASEWNTPQYKVYPGCHNAQLTLESGGITDGMPNNGYNNSPTHGDHGAQNTTWLQFGIDQSPNDPSSKGTRTLYSIGYPGQSSATHAGCLSVNTDGTNGGPVPEGRKPTSVTKAANQQKYGCGDNKQGAGFALNWDYYQLYCPLSAAIPSFPFKCQSIPGGDVGTNKLSPDTGTKQNLTKILTEGMTLYYGMDDNSDNGEHDGEGPLSSPKTQGSSVGPSDGGAVMLIFTPQRASDSGKLYQPEGVLNAGTGFCADGICAGLTTERQMIYQGCDANTGNTQTVRCARNRRHSQRDSYDYSGKQWDPYNCNSGGSQDNHGKPQPDAPSSCDTSKKNPSPSGAKNSKDGMDYWRRHEAHKVYNEPGFQFFEDPDGMASPAAPMYPLPAIYVGTCGVALGGGGQFAMPDSPVTNSAHQLRISTGC